MRSIALAAAPLAMKSARNRSGSAARRSTSSMVASAPKASVIARPFAVVVSRAKYSQRSGESLDVRPRHQMIGCSRSRRSAGV